MRKLVLFMHVSLDGRTTSATGGMEWVKVSDEMFDCADRQSARSDLALYGHGTFNIMDAYWPTAGDEPDADKHAKTHSAWYNKVEKVVASTQLKQQDHPGIKIISSNVAEYINELKQQPGGDIVMFGSPTLARSLMQDNLIDEYWLFINPVIVGTGTPLFGDLNNTINLELAESTMFKNGVVCMHYLKA
jgi:dihydrofolate reductase